MRVGETLYHSARNIDSNNGVVSYSTATAYKTRLMYLTCQPASGYTETLEFGEKLSKTWVIIANYRIFDGVFNEGDLLFLDGAKPSDKGQYEQEANAVITSVRYQNKVIRITAEKKDLQASVNYGEQY